MAFKPTFFYNADEGSNAGGAADSPAASTENQQQNQQVDNNAAAAEISANVIPEDVQKELAELRAFRDANKKVDEKTPEQLLKEQELDKVNFRKYAVENDFAKDEDFVQLETLQQRKDADLVFEKFIEDFKEENEDIEDEKELRELAQEEFNKTYKLTSANEKVKAKGLARLEKEANEIRSPFASKITAAKTDYESKKEIGKAYETQFVPFAKKVTESIPSKITYSKLKSGDSEVEIDIDVTPEDVKEIEEKFIKTHKAFFSFKEGKPDEVQAKLLEKINNYLLTKKRDEGNQKLAEKFEQIGVAKGSTTGADAPFALKNNGGRQEARVLTLQDSNDKMGQARARFN